MSQSSRLLFVQRPNGSLADLAVRAEACGCATASCTSGEEMLQALERLSIDVIFVDAGVEASAEIVSWLKAQPQTRRIPLVTVALEEPATVAAHALALGADDVIELPVEDAEFQARVRALCRLRIMEVEQVRRETVLREFGIRRSEPTVSVPGMDRIGILLIGRAGQEQVQVVTALGGAAAIAYAETGEGALERLRRQDLEVAIITGMANRSELLAFCEAVRADGSLYHLPLILVGRRGQFPDRAEPFGWGVSDVLFQPFQPEVLRLRVQGWVRQQRLRRRLRGLLNGEVLPPTVDRLTRLYGHGFLHRYVEHEIAHVQATGGTFAVAAFAVEGMSRINREWGFVFGDRVLAEMGAMIARSTRAEDLPARYDGDRFCVVLGGADAERAEAAARRVSMAVGTTGFSPDQQRTVRVALRSGIAILEPDDDACRVIGRALLAADPEPFRRAS